MKRFLERRTGLVFGTYRAPVNPWGRTWLIVAPTQEGQMFSVIVGRKGFYIGRCPR